MRFEIREMVATDIPEIVAQEEKVFGDSLGEDLLFSDLKMNPYSFYFVLEVDDAISGYIGIWITDQTAQIINFYIIEKVRGMGFGSTLFEFVLDLCEMSGVRDLTLEVRPTNEKALSFYDKYGFVSISRRAHYYSNGEDALVLLKRFEEKP